MYRSALSPLFVRPKIQALEPEFEQLAERILDDFERQKGGDFVTDVALKFIINCLGAIYNRSQDVDEWFSWGPDVWTAESNGRSGNKLHAYLHRVFIEAQESSNDDAWTFVCNIDLDGQPVSLDEFKGIGSVLLAGGRDTVVKLMSGTMWHLLKTPQDVTALVPGEVALESAIQEMLRAFTPLPAMLRVPPEQHGLADADRDPSKFVAIDFASANYDPEVFAEPGTINIRREKIAHVAFGFGPHTCIGNHIAEIETRVLFTEILKRISRWKFADEPEIEWKAIGDIAFPERFAKLPISIN
jgi:cytochrome P450